MWSRPKISQAAAPPPPPPPPPPPKKKFPILLVLGVIILIVIIVGGIAAFFFFKGLLPQIELPIGGETSTGGEGGGQPQAGGGTTPSLGEYKAGQWVKYRISSQGMELEMEMKVEGFETKEGVNCVKMVYTQGMPSGGKMVMTIWYDPETGKVVWWKSQIIVGGEVVQEKEGSGAKLPTKRHLPLVKDWGSYKGKETITVPAGTFECDKYEKKTPTGKMIFWINTEIPITRMVKMETIVAGEKMVSMELESYGG